MSAPDLIEVVAKAICGIDPWDCYINEAKAALNAINASGTHAVAPVGADPIMMAAGVHARRNGAGGVFQIYAEMIQAISKVTI